MKKKYWVAFASIEKIGAVFIKQLYDYCGGDIERAWKISSSEVKEIEGVKRTSVEAFLYERDCIDLDKEVDYLESKGIKLLCYEDNEYPFLLKNIHAAPMALFYKGDLNRLNFDKTFAVVGSRNISCGAKENVKHILSGFKNTDLTIVSGGARGADSAAHLAALENNIPTIAVLGSGLENVYPKQNAKMFQQIIENSGVVMSEYLPDSPPIAWHFPLRNRIVSGLSHGVLIAEASLNSGALITANIALEQGREVMCIPGSISNPNTQGIYKLVKQGVPIVTNSQDILDIMNWCIEIAQESKSSQPKDLNEIEQEIYDIISKDSLTIDEIFNTLTNKSVDFSKLMIMLTNLEIKGLICTIEGNRYKVK